MVSGLLKSLRPEQWIKNGLLFAGLIFAARPRAGWESLLPELGRVLMAVVLFCLLSSATYLVNDVCDVEADRRHPEKRNRPIAAGRVPLPAALGAAAVLVALALALAGVVSRGAHEPLFLGVAVGYLVLTLAYSLYLKHHVIVDVLTLALGFVVRVVAGCLAVPVAVSPWIVLCTLLLSLFLGLCKRRHELVQMQDTGGNYRKVLPKYCAQLLDQMIATAASLTIMSYSLYTFTAPHKILAEREYPWLMMTIPFVIYGLFRYLYLAYRRDLGGNPELMFTDRPLTLCVALFVLVVLGLMLLPGHATP